MNARSSSFKNIPQYHTIPLLLEGLAAEAAVFKLPHAEEVASHGELLRRE
jgi:hypothetical protein